MKKELLIIIIFTLFTLVGCTKEEKKEITKKDNSKGEIAIKDNEEETVDNSVKKHKVCTRVAKGKDGMDVSFNYDIYYTGNIINMIKSEEKVITDNQADLDEYENAYNSIKSHYVDLENYIIEVNRTTNSTSVNMIINYDIIDIAKLIEIEGEEDNIFENNKPKLSKWQELADKFKVTCTPEEDA